VRFRLLSIAVIAAIIGGVYYAYPIKVASFLGTATGRIPCQEPLTYRIGTIDAGFDISKEELKTVMQDVESIWEKPMDQQLLQYHEDGSVAIHLIYSEEQQRTEAQKKFTDRIETMKEQVSEMRRTYERLSASYKKRSEEYNESLSKYNQAVREYNAYVEKWRSKGGLPQDKKPTVDRMLQKNARLERIVDRKKENMEVVRKRANAKSERLNDLVGRQNELINEYNRRFGDARTFNQGHYIQQGLDKRINIYQFGNRAELKTVLAHESGHALGIGHVGNSKSVMNSTMKEQDIFNLSLSRQDISAMKQRCGQ